MSRFLKEHYQKMTAYVPGEQPRDMAYIKLNTNESPFPPAPEVMAAITDEQLGLQRLYADPTCKVLKEKLADLHSVRPENLFIANGSDDVLNFAFMAFPGAKGARFADITYGFYTVYCDIHGVPYQQMPLGEDFTLDYRDYCNTDSLVVIANPNAPTGLSIPVWQVEEIVKSNPDNVVVIDEAYVDFGGESACPLIEKYENLLVVRTYSKSRCLAGGRLGYAIGSPALIADLEKLKFSTNPFSVTRLTMVMGEATVDADAYYREKCEEIIRVRRWTAQELEKLGFTVLPSDTNFLFAATPALSGGQLYLELKKRGILVRHFSADRIKDYNRITIGTAEQMETFIKTVGEILAGGSYENSQN